MARHRLVAAVLIAGWLGVGGPGNPAWAVMEDPLPTRLTPDVVDALFPDVDGLGAIDGDPPIAEVVKQGAVVGYLFSTHETVHPSGYNGSSFDIVVGLDTAGDILGHVVVEHREPLVGGDMVPIAAIDAFLTRLHGQNIRTLRKVSPDRALDAVSGATISARAMGFATANAAVVAAYLKQIVTDDGAGLSIDRTTFRLRTWQELIADGSIGERTFTNRDVRAAFAARHSVAVPPLLDLGPDDAPFITLFAALATGPAIGRNLIGQRAFRAVNQGAKVGEHQIMIGTSGAYRWLPRNPALVDRFARARIVQGGRVIELRSRDFYRARRLAIANHPPIGFAGRFRMPQDTGFKALDPWTLEIDIVEAVPPDQAPRAITLSLPYRVPVQHVQGSDFALEEAGFKTPTTVAFGLWRESTLTEWQQSWLDNGWAIVGLLGLLAAVTLVVAFQARLTRLPRLHPIVRNGLLLVTLVWLGWIAGNQLTVLTVINYLHLIFGNGRWVSVLVDPLLVILTVYVLITLVLWGRGVFCGWLCPFGALQELAAAIARRLRLARYEVPPALQARLWWVKYGVLAGLVALSFHSVGLATAAAEVEPFKTAISLKFARAWPYVLYTGLLLAVGLFVERAFCRYLCPLGAALAIGGRLRRLNPLRRRADCGSPCHLCEHKCPIGAIEPSGKINMTECFYCLDCQVVYYDDHTCPPLVAARKHAANDAIAQAAE